MSTGKLEIIYGEGPGKTAMALGKGLEVLSEQQRVTVIQFLKGSQTSEVMKRLEPEMKVFRFEKSGCNYDELSDLARQEESANIRNGVNYARKVLATGECGLLILDEVLGVVDQDILMESELEQLLESRGDVDVILTGRVLPERLAATADRIERITRIEPAHTNSG